MTISRSNIVIGILLVAVTVLVIVVLNRPEPEVELFDPQPYLDTIAYERENAHYWEDQAHMYEAERDGLAVQRQKVKTIYVPQYIYITDHADLDQLDSVIRANW